MAFQMVPSRPGLGWPFTPSCCAGSHTPAVFPEVTVLLFLQLTHHQVNRKPPRGAQRVTLPMG